MYFDTYKGKRKRPAVEEDSPQTKRRKASNESQVNGLPSHVENDREDMADSEFEGDDDSMEAQNEMATANTQEHPGGPALDVRLIPDDLDNAARERFAMYAFINARHRGFCRRRLANEYFNNPKSKHFKNIS